MKSLTVKLMFILFLFFSFSLFAASPPPGTIALKPSKAGIKHAAYIDMNEITVANWREFLYWTSEKYGKESAEYGSKLPDSMVIQTYQPHWEHPSFASYPIIGISYEQAIEYCKWRTNVVNEYLKSKKLKYTVSYSLPTETDLQEAFKQQKNKTNATELTHIAYKNKKLINIADNAQELTANKTVLHGEHSATLQFTPYQGPNNIIGFRCVAEILVSQ
jgi:formylglycine-generating enzyme required for sulfatase activity